MSTEGKTISPLDDLLSKMENDLRLKRRDIDSHLAPIEMALAAYRRALEASAATEYATAHQLRRPDLAALSPRIAAFNLMGIVEALREMPKTSQVVAQAVEGPALAAKAEVTAPSEAASEVRSIDEALPKIVAACDGKKLVVVGALGGRKRPLPEPLEGATEWVDTSDGGAHAIGNLPTRIRQGRIFGVIICEQAISHQHSEPLVSAARGAQVPVGFAGKGGGAAIGRALKAIEEQLP